MIKNMIYFEGLYRRNNSSPGCFSETIAEADSSKPRERGRVKGGWSKEERQDRSTGGSISIRRSHIRFRDFSVLLEMAIYVSGKMKRKDLDEVYGDFSDLMFSAPATKIRRLDGEPFTTSVLGKELPDEEMSAAATVLDARPGLTEAVSPSSLNEERALVMYRPSDAHLASSFKINPKLITSLKHYTFWPRNPNMIVEERVEEAQSPGNKCLAVVPWVPSHAAVTRQVMEALASGNELIEEPMEDEGAAHAFMEIEEANGESDNTGVGAQDNQPWQQHCMTPQLLQSNSTIMWS